TTSATITAQGGLHFSADAMSLNGTIAGSGPRLISPATPGIGIDLGGRVASGSLSLTATSLAVLAGNSPTQVGIGDTGAINVSGVVFDAPLVLKGGDITFNGFTKNAGSLFIDATGAVSGSLNLASGTGPLGIHSFSTNLFSSC